MHTMICFKYYSLYFFNNGHCHYLYVYLTILFDNFLPKLNSGTLTTIYQYYVCFKFIMRYKLIVYIDICPCIKCD